MKNLEKPTPQRIILVTLLALVALTAIVFIWGLSSFLIYTSAQYLVRSFIEFETIGAQVGGFFISLTVLVMSVFFVYCGYRIGKACVRFSTDYLYKKSPILDEKNDTPSECQSTDNNEKTKE